MPQPLPVPISPQLSCIFLMQGPTFSHLPALMDSVHTFPSFSSSQQCYENEVPSISRCQTAPQSPGTCPAHSGVEGSQQCSCAASPGLPQLSPAPGTFTSSQNQVQSKAKGKVCLHLSAWHTACSGCCIPLKPYKFCLNVNETSH